MSSAALPVATAAQFSPNLAGDLLQMLHYAFMQHAFEAGTIIAIVAAVAGQFVVLRGLSFAGHALAEIGFAGASGAVLLGIDPMFGMLTFSAGSGLAIGILGKRVYGRDVVIGVVLAFCLGLGALFLTLYQGLASTSFGLLFGDIFGVSTASVWIAAAAGAVTLVAVAFMYRPLLFASLDPDVAEARGVPVRLLSMAFMLLLALAVSVSILVVGVLLIFALLVTPAATAQRLTARPLRAFWLGIAFSLGITWVTLFIAYYVAFAPGFFITALAFASYVAARAWQAMRRRSGTGRKAMLQGAGA